MKAHAIRLHLLAIIALIAGLHIVALKFYLYFYYPWFDTVVHFLAGLWVAMFALTIFYFDLHFFKLPTAGLVVFGIAVAASLAIGVLWEYFEYDNHLIFVTSQHAYITDTLSDISMDIIGGLVAAVFFVFGIGKKIEWKKI